MVGVHPVIIISHLCVKIAKVNLDAYLAMSKHTDVQSKQYTLTGNDVESKCVMKLICACKYTY